MQVPVSKTRAYSTPVLLVTLLLAIKIPPNGHWLSTLATATGRYAASFKPRAIAVHSCHEPSAVLIVCVYNSLADKAVGKPQIVPHKYSCIT